MRLAFCAALIAVSGVFAGVFATSGAAKATTPGDGCFVVQGGFGKVTVSLTRGVVFGRFLQGTLSYSDVNSDKPQLPISNATPVKMKDHLWVYGPADALRFRATGPTKLIVNATFINLSVAGKGTAWLSRAGLDNVPSTLVPPSNAYSADAASFCEDNFQKMPLTLTKVQISSPITTGQ